MSRGIRFVTESRKRLTLFGVLVVALAAGVAAFAYFSSIGSGTGSASTGTLGAPTNVSGSVSGSTVTVSWSAPTGGTVSPSGYYVTRYDGITSVAACGSSAASPLPATPTHCDDTSVPSGTYTYTVVAVYRTWTATSAASPPVTVAALDHFQVSAPASATAGSAFSVTVTAKDASNNTISTYTGTIHFTSSDGAAVLPSNYTFVSGDGGSHTFTNGATLKTAGSQTVNVNDTVQTTKTGSATVSVAPAALHHFTLSPNSGSQTAGSSFSLTLTAFDQFNNQKTNYTGTVTATSNDPQGVLPSPYTFTTGTGNDNGQHTFSVTLKTAGAGKTVTFTDGSINVSGSFTVNPATASTLVFSTQPGSATAGSAFGQQPVVKTQDSFGNNSTVGLGASRNVTITIASGGGTLQGTATLDIGTSAGNGTATFTNLRIDQAGAKTLQAAAAAGSPTLASATSNSFTVSPATASTLVFSTQPGGATAGSNFTQQPVVKTQDSFGNNSTVGLGASRNITVAIATGGGTLQGTATLDIGTAAGNGTVTYTNLRIDQAGVKTLSATAAAGSPSLATATSASFTVSAAAATTITKTAGDSQSAPINNAFATALKVTVTDNFNNPVQGATVTFTAPATGPSGTFANSSNTTTATTAADGTASASTFTANGSVGTYNVSASASGTNTVNFSLTNYGPWTWTANGAAQTWTTSTAKNVTYPGVTASGDLILLGLVQQGNNTAPTISGWSQLQTINKGNTARLTVYWRAAGAETSVSVTPPAGNPSAAWVVDYKRTGGPAPALAGTATTGSGNASSTIAAPAMTTTGVNATVVSFVGIPLANTLSLFAAQSFTLRAALTSSSPTTAFGLADRMVAAAGSVTAPTWQQTAGTGDWALITGAFN